MELLKKVKIKMLSKLIDSLGFNRTFSTSRLHCGSEMYVPSKKVKLMRKLTISHAGDTYDKPLQ